MLPNCHSEEVNSNQSHLCSKWPKGQEPWRRGATGFCQLLWQLLVVVKLWLLFPIVSHLRLFLVVYAWWILLQSWGTMRFGNHRGLKPSDVQVTGNTLAAKLTRSKTTGDVKDVAFRMVHISSCCFLSAPSCLSTGWALLKSLADFPKDFLLSAPSSNCSGCLQKELRYDIGSAMQNRVLSSLRFADQNSLTRSVASFWTPHSARAFLPSAPAALGVPMEQRDCLGGWVAQGSDNYSRVAARMFSNLQKLVISSSGDPFAEADTDSQLDDHHRPKGYSVEDRAKCFEGLESTTPLRPQQELEELRLKKEDSRKQQTWNQIPKGMTKHRQSQKSRKTKGSKARTPSQNLWGQTPKQLVNSQEPSFRKATTGRNGTRVLHRLGACFMVPGIDYPRYVHLGALMPRQSDFDSICKLCARKGTEVAQGDSDVTQTSSLSEAGQ